MDHTNGSVLEWQHTFHLVTLAEIIYQDTSGHIMKRTSRCWFVRTLCSFSSLNYWTQPLENIISGVRKIIKNKLVLTVFCLFQVLQSMSPVTSSSTASDPSLKLRWWETFTFNFLGRFLRGYTKRLQPLSSDFWIRDEKLFWRASTWHLNRSKTLNGTENTSTSVDT